MEKPDAPSCERNREPILAVLRQHFADRRRVLEIGSGTGQHAVFFAAALPQLEWQASDRAVNLPGIRAWLEYALEHGLARFEPGAQGEHKLARGFEPVPTWSAYWIADPRMRRIVANFLAREGEAMQDYEAETARRLPYKSQSL